MVDWPTSPVPSSVSPAQLVDPAREFSADQGYTITRSKYSRGTRRYVVTYVGLRGHNLHVLQDFVRRVARGRANTFGFTMPFGHAVLFASNTTPIAVQTQYANGIQTYDWVTITGVLGNAAANGTFQCTRVDGNNFAINGTIGSGTYTGGGLVFVRIPVMRLVVPETGEVPAVEKLFGPVRDDRGLYQWSFLMEESL